MARACFLVFLFGIATAFGFLGVLVQHHEAGNRFYNSARRLRSCTLVYDSTRVSREALPIRIDLKPGLAKLSERSPLPNADLRTQGWYLGDKCDGTPMEPAREQLAGMYHEVDEARVQFPKTVRLCWGGYVSLALGFLCASVFTLRRAR